MTTYILFMIAAGLIVFYENGHCLRMMKVIPGVPTISYYDEKYIRDIVFNTRRYSRKSDYVVNLEFETLVPFGYNLSASGIYYQYLHNEYRRSFVEWHGNWCNLILKEQLVGAVIRKVGFNQCPMPAGKYRLYNMSFNQEFPNIFPFEKGKGELILRREPSKQIVVRGDLGMTFIQRTV